MSATKTCRHVHLNGAMCQSPPLRNRDYCHFHLDQIGRQMRAARARARHLPASLKLPLLEDPFAVQVAANQLYDAIAHREIDLQQARLQLSVLRFAAGHLKTLRAWKQEPVFAADASVAVGEWPSFEQEHALPEGFDLSVEPEVAFPPPAPLETPDQALRAKIRRALGEAERPPAITADQVEMMDIYEHHGQEAATRFADTVLANDPAPRAPARTRALRRAGAPAQYQA